MWKEKKRASQLRKLTKFEDTLVTYKKNWT